MYDELKEIVFDGTEYYYNTGKYILVFDPAEGGRIWIYNIIIEDIENRMSVPFEILNEFINFATFIKNMVRAGL